MNERYDTAFDAAEAAVFDSDPRYPMLLVMRDGENFWAETYQYNEMPAAVYAHDERVVFWGHVAPIDYFDLFTTASEWGMDEFLEDCRKHDIDIPVDADEIDVFREFSEMLWNLYSDDEKNDFRRSVWDHYGMSEKLESLITTEELRMNKLKIIDVKIKNHNDVARYGFRGINTVTLTIEGKGKIYRPEFDCGYYEFYSWNGKEYEFGQAFIEIIDDIKKYGGGRHAKNPYYGKEMMAIAKII